MDFELKGKTAFVTGGSRGIGRAIALTLAKQGVNIAICGRTQESLDATAADIQALGVKAWAYQTDVSKVEELEAFADKALAAAGGIDILVNNAVTSTAAPFDEQTDEMFRYHIDVKLMAYIRLARIILPHLEQQGWGRIVNIGGMTARITAPLIWRCEGFLPARHALAPAARAGPRTAAEVAEHCRALPPVCLHRTLLTCCSYFVELAAQHTSTLS